jgi:SsrA-binding protein
MHKREIRKLIGYTTQQGYTLVPLKLYINDRGLVKIELAVAKGKKLYDKRQSIAKKDAERRIQKELRHRQKGY